MTTKRRRFIAAFINSLLLFFSFLIHFGGIRFLHIGQAVPMLILPILVSISVFFSENTAIVAGLISGILMDSSASGTSCFNTLFFAVVCILCHLLANRFLNRNLKAAVCLAVGVSLGYYFLKYLVFFAFSAIPVPYDYFISYLIPSAVYTAVWIIPFYFLQKKLSQ